MSEVCEGALVTMDGWVLADSHDLASYFACAADDLLRSHMVVLHHSGSRYLKASRHIVSALPLTIYWKAGYFEGPF